MKSKRISTIIVAVLMMMAVTLPMPLKTSQQEKRGINRFGAVHQHQCIGRD